MEHRHIYSYHYKRTAGVFHIAAVAKKLTKFADMTPAGYGRDNVNDVVEAHATEYIEPERY